MAFLYDYLVKMVVVGDAQVGKSCVVQQYAEGVFTERYITTIGIDFKIKQIENDGKPIKLQIWDTGGQERFRTITQAYYRGAHAIVVVVDLTKPNSVISSDVKRWLADIREHGNKDSIVHLFGNKADSADRACTGAQLAEIAAANDMCCQMSEVDARTGRGVDAAFSDVVTHHVLATEDRQHEYKAQRAQQILQPQISLFRQGWAGGDVMCQWSVVAATKTSAFALATLSAQMDINAQVQLLVGEQLGKLSLLDAAFDQLGHYGVKVLTAEFDGRALEFPLLEAAAAEDKAAAAEEDKKKKKCIIQ